MNLQLPTYGSVHRQIAINHATVREQLDMSAFITKCVERNVPMVSVWGDEISKVGLKACVHLLADTGLRVFGYNRAGPLLADSAPQRQALIDDARRQIDQAKLLGADHILVFPGGLADGARDLVGGRAQTEEAVAGLLDYARDCEIKLALEPLHPMLVGERTTIGTLSHTNDICDRLGDGVGIVIDAYHVWWDERLDAEIARAGASGRILGLHVNDWLVPTRHLQRDRGMMGDGIIDLKRMFDLTRQAGYTGPVEVEIFSDAWWRKDADLVLDTAISRCTDIFAL